ncbi:MAG: PPOX class F420-dependent oxidoreductase [Actinomycetales bacterium]
MDLDEARRYVAEHHRAVLATLRQDGTPQLSPVTAAVDQQGRVVVSSRETAYKVRNLRRTPRAWLCVFPDEFFGRWVQVEGDVEIVSLPEALEPLVDYYRSVSGEHPDWDDYRRAMLEEQRCVIRVSVTKAGPDRAG